MTSLLAWGALLAAAAIAAYALYERRTLRAQIRELHTVAPHDPDTGLLSQRAFLQRLTAETRRVDRFGGSVHIWIAHAGANAPAVGRALRHVLRFPELGFRIADDAVCVVVTQLSDAALDGDDLAQRLSGVVGAGVVRATWHAYPRDGATPEDIVTRVSAQRQVAP